MQKTLKIKLPPGRQKGVKDVLAGEGFSFSANENAFWRASSLPPDGGLTVTFFTNGTVLFQGDEKRMDHIVQAVTQGRDGSGSPVHGAEEAVLGLDESGKGDVFGPLVLAGAVNRPGRDGGPAAGHAIMDSKKLSSGQIKELYPAVMAAYECRVRLIAPEEYNALYAVHRNLNVLMTEEYVALISCFDEKTYERIILDKFSQSGRQNDSIEARVPRRITIVEKAEEFKSVAAASIIARYRFLEWMEKNAPGLPIGSGPAACGRFLEFRAKLPPDEFKRIAKAHFKPNEEMKLF